MSISKIIAQKGINLLFNKGKNAKSLLSETPLLQMSKEIATKTNTPILHLRLKPDITVPVRPETMGAKAPSFAIHKGNIDTPAADAELGNLALRINSAGHKIEAEFRKTLQNLFPGYDVATRTKGVDSLHSKLKKYIPKKGITVTQDKEAYKMTTDYVAGRIELKQLSKDEINNIIENTIIDGKKLTRREKRFVQRLLKNDKSLSKTQKNAGEKYLKQVLLNMAEKQSEPAFNSIMLGMMKDALNRGITTIEKLAAENINPKLIKELQTNSKIQPIKVTRFCNYRGPNNIPVFTDNQIRQIKKMQLATGEKFSITTCSEKIDVSKYGFENLTDIEKSAIKQGGYTRAQMNIELPDGTISELQIAAGKDPFYFIEHDLVYNNLQNKNTINEAIKPFIEKYSFLDKTQKNIFGRYSQNCYLDDRLEGLVGTKRVRKNPHGLGRSFSRESMHKLYLKDEADQKAKMKTFAPYIEEAVNYVA